MKPRTIILGTLVLCQSMVFAQLASGPSAEEAFQIALQEKTSGKVKEANKNFAYAAQLAPANWEIQKAYAKSLIDLRQYALGYAKWKDIAGSNPNDVESLRQCFELATQLRRWQEVLQYGQLLGSLTNDIKWLPVGMAYFHLEDYGQALSALKKAEVQEPNNSKVPYFTALAHTEMNQYAKAIPHLHKSLSLNPGDAQTTYQLAMVYYAVPDDQNALKYMLAAAQLGFPKNSLFLDNLATVYLNLKEYDKAINILTELAKRKPGDPELTYTIAHAYFKAGKWDEAIANWEVLATTPSERQAKSLYMVGVAFQRKGEKAKGQQICDKAIALEPGLAKMRKEMAMML